MFIIYLALFLVVPILIIIKWKKRPVLSVVVAILILFLEILLPTLVTTVQAMMIYGEGDPQLMAGGIAQSIVTGMLMMIVFAPIFAALSWLTRRKLKS